MKIQSIIILFAILLSSCSPKAVQMLTDTPNPTAAEKIPPSSTATIVPTLTLTFTSIPTMTATPSIKRVVFSMLSPDGSLAIQTKDWELFEVLNSNDEQVIWSFIYDRAKFGDNRYIWEGGYEPYYWSQDGKHIFIKAHQSRDGGVKYYGNVFGARQGLVMFDVDTGVMTDIIPENYGGGYTFAISPDESGIVYVNQLETPLVLRWLNLSTREEKILATFDEHIFDVGAFGWSPQKDQLIYSTLEIPNPDELRPEKIFDFYIIDLRSLQMKLVFEGLDNSLHFESWNEENRIEFVDWQNLVWQLELESDTFTSKGTATPNP